MGTTNAHFSGYGTTISIQLFLFSVVGQETKFVTGLQIDCGHNHTVNIRMEEKKSVYDRCRELHQLHQ